VNPLAEETRILVVDDESSVRFLLSEELAQHGYEVSTAASGEEALAMLEQATFDLMLLDLKMPGMDGIAVMRAARYLAPQTVVVMLTAHATLDSAVEALRYGGHDYLVKPSSPDEILASVQKGLTMGQQRRRQEDLIRQMGDLARELAEGEAGVTEAEGPGDEQPRYLRVGDLLLDRARLSVVSAGESIPLTPSEYRIILCLMENSGTTVSLGALAEAVHGIACEEGAARNAISTHLWRLRRKLDAATRTSVQIDNIRGVGYVLLESQAD
jgi:DNA-binding response OmpR family regulator